MLSLPRPAPLSVSLLAFIGGVTALQTSASLPRLPMAFFIPATLLTLAILLSGHRFALRWQNAVLLLLSIAAFISGFGYAATRAASRLADQLPAQWQRKDIELIGMIDALPVDDAISRRFSLSVSEVLTPGAVVPQRLSLSWYKQSFDRQQHYEVPPLNPGSRWRLKVRLKRAHANANPGGFDAESWLLQNNWRATGYVRDAAVNRELTPFVASPGNYLSRLRDSMQKRILAQLGERRYSGVIVALAIGEQRAIPAQQWDVFNRTGITHLVSISGLHVTIFALLIGGGLLALLRRLPRLTSRCPAVRLAVIGGFAASAFYVALAGAGIPAQRTLIMLGVAATALWFNRLDQPWRTWLWSLWLVVIVDPWAPLSAGFWLSFAAVGWLLYAASGRIKLISTESPGVRQRLTNSLTATTRTQWIVTLGLMPFLIASFAQFSLISFPANLWAIPWITLLVVPLTLAGMLPGCDLLWLPAYTLVEILMDGLTWLSQLPFAVWQQHDAPLWTIIAALIGVLWMLAPRGVPGRGLGIIWCLPVFLLVPRAPPPASFTMTVLDVGQGLAVVVRTAHSTLLYDSGPRYAELSDAGNRIIIPYLRHQAIAHPDTLVISHNDLDHAGGAESLRQAWPAVDFIASMPENKMQPVKLCRAGMSWQRDGVEFRFLSPADDLPSTAKNERSCVLQIRSQYGSALLTGDIGSIGEHYLIDHYADSLKSNVLLAPHHGSKNSSTSAFVRAVSPQHVVFSVGYQNVFGFPPAATLARYQTIKAKSWRTDVSGALTFRFDKDGISVEEYRKTAGRYWGAEDR